MEMSLQILVIAIFIGATMTYYRKPRVDSLKRVWKKIPPFSRMDNGVIYDPHQAQLLAYYFATFGQRFNGESPPYESHGWDQEHKFKRMMEKAAFKFDNGDFFILYWWRREPDNPKLYIFNNKQSFLDEIYNHWGVELHDQLKENIGCERQRATVTA